MKKIKLIHVIKGDIIDNGYKKCSTVVNQNSM